MRDGRALAAAVLFGLLGFLGCDTSVDAFENDRPFSIIGVLNAGADSQFVRVARLNDSLAFGAPPVPLPATVTTTRLSTGEPITWNDSLMSFEFARGLGVIDQRLAHNVWTDVPIEAGATYRFTVTGRQGAASTATVTIPERPPTPDVSPPDRRLPAWGVQVPGQNLADIRVLTREHDPETGRVVTRRQSFVADTTENDFLDIIRVRFAVDDVVAVVQGPLVDVRLQVVAAGPEWPDPGTLAADDLLDPGTVTNVENGFGYLAGVHSRTVPLCRTPASPLDEGFRCQRIGVPTGGE
jgi:hypothetical protein